MMKIVGFLLVLISCTSELQAQNIQVREASTSINGITSPVFQVELPFTDINTAVKKFKIKLKDNQGRVKGKKELIAEHVIIPSISKLPLVVRTKFETSNKITRLSSAFWMNDSCYLSMNTYPKESTAAKKYLRDFAIGVTETYYDELIKGRSEMLQKNQDELDNLKIQRVNSDKDLLRYHELLLRAQADTSKNNAAQAVSTFRLNSAKSEIEDLKKSKASLRMIPDPSILKKISEVPEVQ